MGMAKLCLLVLLSVVAVQSFAAEEYTVGILTQTVLQLDRFLQISDPVSQMDISGRRFYKRIFSGAHVVMSYTGHGMINGAITTQLLITSFPSITTVISFGSAASPNVQEIRIGDVVIPAKLAYTGVWYWQNQGDTSNKGVASLTFGEYNTDNSCSRENDLNRVWFQGSEVHYSFVDYRKVFWVNANTSILPPTVSLKSCADVNGKEMCLPHTSKVSIVDAGCSSDIYVSNAAYAKFLLSEFQCSTIDKDSAAVALTSLSNRVAFVTVRSISNYAGVSPHEDNKYSALVDELQKQNSVTAVEAIVSQLTDIKIRMFPSQ